MYALQAVSCKLNIEPIMDFEVVGMRQKMLVGSPLAKLSVSTHILYIVYETILKN